MATCLVKFGIACIGAAGGFTLALFIMSWQDGGVISSGIGKILFFIAMIVVGIIVIFVILKPALIIATSVLGAYSFVFGVDSTFIVFVVFLAISFFEYSWLTNSLLPFFPQSFPD